MNYQYLNWGPFVMRVKVEDYIIDKLIEEGRKSVLDLSSGLAGHVDKQLRFPTDIKNWFYNETKNIFTGYREAHCQYHSLEMYPTKLGAIDLWINFMKPGDFNPPHVHDGDYSFVLFCNSSNELLEEMKQYKGTAMKPGQLQFIFDKAQRPQWMTFSHTITPERGDMWIFPAMLQHWVAPYKSNIERITVSGNVSITNKDQLPYDYF